MAQTFSKIHETEDHDQDQYQDQDQNEHQEQINNFISKLILKSQSTHENENNKYDDIDDIDDHDDHGDHDDKIEEEYRELIINTVYGISDIKEREYYTSLLYRLILYTRDNVNGLGHPILSYMMLGVWIQLANESHDIIFKNETNAIIKKAIESFIYLENYYEPYGDWNDMKELCNYMRNDILYDNDNSTESIIESPIFNYMINLINDQLYKEECILVNNHIPNSLLCKYLPREKSKKFGWIVPYIATSYYSEWIATTKNHYSYKKAYRKCLTHYRILVSSVSKQIDHFNLDRDESFFTHNVNKYINNNHYDNHYDKDDNNKAITQSELIDELMKNQRYLWSENIIHDYTQKMNYCSINSFFPINEEEKFEAEADPSEDDDFTNPSYEGVADDCNEDEDEDEDEITEAITEAIRESITEEIPEKEAKGWLGWLGWN